MSNTRHLLVTNDFPPKVGGIQSYLWELWRRMDPDTFSVLTATSHPDAQRFDREQAELGINIDRIPEKLLFFPTPKTIARIRETAKRVGASLVLLDPTLPLGLVGPRLGIPYGVILHGAEITVPGHIPPARQALASVLRHASIIISAGSYPTTEAQRSTRGVLEHVVNIAPGVDCNQFVALSQTQREKVRERLDLPTSTPLVTSISRLVPRKGMDVLIKASHKLARSYPDLSVAIAGDGRDRPRLERLIDQTGARVKLLGRVSEKDKADLLGASDIFVMACRNRWGGLEQEGFGIVFMEAAACAIPQIAGDSGGSAEAVVDGVTGIVLDRPHDPSLLAESLRRLLADDALRRDMGIASRQRALASFDYTHLARRLAEALNERSMELKGR